MDLRLPKAKATRDEREAVDALLGPPASGWEGGTRSERDAHFAEGGAKFRAKRHLLLPTLQAVQQRVGWISEGALGYVCERLQVAPADAWGVTTFYALLATEPRPRRVLHVCDDIGCRSRGADALIEELEKTVGPAHEGGGLGSIDPEKPVWMRSPCLGLCDCAPAALLVEAGREPREVLLGRVTSEQAVDALTTGAAEEPTLSGGPLPQQGDPSLRLLARVGVVDPTRLEAYRAAGGYQALTRAMELGPDAVIREVIASQIVGRGGAAFPMGKKWEAVAQQPARPHYLICNADESEPGTFKDRVLLEGDPFAIVEAMTIAAFATGCERGYLYIRGEYPLGTARIENAVAQARAAGLLGDDILGRGFRFELEVRRGGGAYICGEETAIFNSIEGYRGEPRSKPPFPVVAGLFGKPTVVNNVETIANVLPIVLHGGEAFAHTGTAQSTGTKLFCVSGTVQRPGVYEVPFGTTLRELLTLAGGVPEGRTLKAVLMGGAAGGFIRADEIELPLTLEAARAAKTTLGSGVVMAFDDSVPLEPIVLRIAQFFRDESCGQCVPCRIGTVRQEEALHRVCSGGGKKELGLLDDLGAAMRDASICGLGQTASAVVQSAIHRLGLFQGGTR